ncbi:MAG TPA: vanadium-dependent haloperoxidase [Anaerolineales bacterium]
MDIQVGQRRRNNRRGIDRSAMLGLILVLIVGLVSSALNPAVAAASTGPNSVVLWNTIALNRSITIGKQSIPQSQMYLARVQAAVYNAVVAIEGRYQPYKSSLARRPGASVDAAVAASAHAVLGNDFPSQQAALDQDYAAALQDIPDGDAKTAGIEVGEAAAGELLALRKGDGLEADIGFVMPQPGPGVWQLPPGVAPLTPWVSQLRPYLIKDPSQFRPGPPPELDSSTWAREYEEVRLMGRKDSPYRTAEQTDIALFWTMQDILMYNNAFQEIAQDPRRGLDAVEAARLFAVGNLIGADSLIACFDAKYHYLFWRPAFSIPGGDSDGNPDTIPDPTWLPLLNTPPHPEYPSGHSCHTSAMAESLAVFFGTQRINLELKSTVPGLVQPTRHYKYSRDLVKEIIDARVWGGIHYRGSDVNGTILGRKVAQWALKRYFLPVGEDLRQSKSFGVEALWLPFLSNSIGAK